MKFPINYVGGKHRVLPQLMPILPPARVFYDVFCGGLTVGINAACEKILAVDKIQQMVHLLKYWRGEQGVVEKIEDVIRSRGLSKYNADAYYELRRDYNKNPNSLLFGLLPMYSFNHQIRFNTKGQFNMPFGRDRSEFNSRMKKNLAFFIERLQQKDVEIVTGDYQQVCPESGDLVYCDPPYRLSMATYNVGWDDSDDLRLLKWLDGLHSNNIKFCISNVMQHNGRTNELLREWSKKYKTTEINISYNNCNYHKKTKTKTVEVVVTNYEI